jgi:predicted adenylyl cyclase CyaB
MNIFILCSKHFYNKIPIIKEELEKAGHIIKLPNSFDSPFKEEEMKKKGLEDHIKWKGEMIKRNKKNISSNDAVLVLNFDKNGETNYIGGATFLEIYEAFDMNKKIFFYNPIPDNKYFKDELTGINPVIINKNLSLIEQNQESTNKNIEVEIQTFISVEKYNALMDFFKQNSEFVKEDFQETFYFDENSNLRIQRNNSGAKLWHKSGNVHDEFMEEIEILTKKEDFENLEKFLNKLGYNVKIKWLRKRNEFDWNGIKVCIDYTKGYGYILELERMSSEEDKEKVLEELKQKINELNIQVTSKEEFTERYNYYKENWRRLIA